MADRPSKGPDGVCRPCSEIYFGTQGEECGDLNWSSSVQPRRRSSRQPAAAPQEEHRLGYGSEPLPPCCRGRQQFRKRRAEAVVSRTPTPWAWRRLWRSSGTSLATDRRPYPRVTFCVHETWCPTMKCRATSSASPAVRVLEGYLLGRHEPLFIGSCRPSPESCIARIRSWRKSKRA